MSVSLEGVTFRIERVAAGRLSVDPRIQRPLDMQRVQKMIEEFSPAALGTISVSKRKRGELVVLDGQHRFETVKRVKDTERYLDAKVYVDLTIQQEAELFRLLNDTKSLSPLVKFRIAVVEKHPIEVACDKILRTNKLVAEGGHPNSFLAVVALVKLYTADSVAAAVTVAFLATAWGQVSKDGLDSRLVDGFGRVFRKHGETINQGQLATKLQKRGTPAALIGEARTLAKMRGVQVGDAVADIVVGLYNKSRPEEHKLPTWG